MIMELPDQGGNPFGGMAQLVARLHGMQKVRGSNPLTSTKLNPKISVRRNLGIFCFPQLGDTHGHDRLHRYILYP